MANLSTEQTRDLAEKARRGDVDAGCKLIERCREGMVKPDWEEEPVLDAEAVERHLKRRTVVGSGKGTM